MIVAYFIESDDVSRPRKKRKLYNEAAPSNVVDEAGPSNSVDDVVLRKSFYLQYIILIYLIFLLLR